MLNLYCETSGAATGRRRAFTITELIIAVAALVLLASMVVVAARRAVRTAQTVRTQILMSSIGQAMSRFEQDVGYYPPVLDAGRNLVDPWGAGRCSGVVR